MKTLKKCSVILLALLCLAACGRGHMVKEQPQEIQTASVVRGPIERKVLFTGSIDAESAFEVYPRASGKVIKKILKEGDSVKRNQAILLVERDDVGYTYKPMPVVSLEEGQVGSITVDVGAQVDPQHPVAVVVRPGKMRVKLDVPERYLGDVKAGDQVPLYVDYLDGETFTGTIVTASPVIDHKTRTARVEVVVEDTAGKLRHGMFGRMNLVVERHDDVLLAPLGAISWEGEKQFAYKVVDGSVKRSQINVGIRNDERVEILEGLAEGDLVAVGSLLDLRDGEKVIESK